MQFNNAGSGLQSINHGRDQNLHSGSGDVITGTLNIGRDLVRTFVTNVTHDPHRTLWEAVAGVGASHDAEQQFSRGECLPGTREKAIEAIHEWRTMSEPGSPPVCWLSGAAGVGKTAIAINIAKACAANDSLVVSFFFFRSDPKRNNPSFLFLSIAHGLTASIPSLRRAINARITSDPRILDSRLEEQCQELVLKPSLELVPDPSTNWFKRTLKRALPKRLHQRPNLVVIDGLDECSDSETQLRILSIIFSAFQKSTKPPLRFLICSRPESWIREALYSDKFHRFAKHIVLDDEFDAGNDIEHYLLHEFHDISTSPKYSHIIFPRPWPTPEVVSCLVRNSSGQFVYAVTVVRWIRADGFHPFEQLQIILKRLPNRGSSSPFRELDNLYYIVLCTHPDPSTLRHVLAATLLLPQIRILPSHYKGVEVATPTFIEWMLGLPHGQVSLTLRSMHSVLSIGKSQEQIRVLHTSFSEFLLEPSRSGEFFLDKRPALLFFLRRWLQSLITSCHIRLGLSSTDHRSLPLPYYELWDGWVAFARHMGTPTEEVLSDLEGLDLSALLTMALSKPDETYSRDYRTYGLEWYKLFRILERISSWLKPKEDNDRCQRIAKRLETVQQHFHIAVPQKLATPEFLEDLSTWMSLNLARFNLDSASGSGRADRSMREYLAMAKENSKRMIIVDYECSCSMSMLHLRQATIQISKPNARYAHYHVNMPAACALTLKTLAKSLQEKKRVEGMSRRAGLITLGIIDSELVPRCPPGDSRALSVFRQLIESLAIDSARGFIQYVSIPSSLRTKTMLWLETFSKEYVEEVEDIWRK